MEVTKSVLFCIYFKVKLTIFSDTRGNVQLDVTKREEFCLDSLIQNVATDWDGGQTEGGVDCSKD